MRLKDRAIEVTGLHDPRVRFRAIYMISYMGFCAHWQ